MPNKYQRTAKKVRDVRETVYKPRYESESARVKVAEFNRDHSIGTLIRWRDPTDRDRVGQGFTKSPARVVRGLSPAVDVAGQMLPVLLSWVTQTDGALSSEDCEPDE